MELSKEGRQQLALALILLKDFKSQEGAFDVEMILLIKKLAAHIRVEQEYHEMIYKIPPMSIKPKE